MNLIQILSAPLKKIYGANKSNDSKSRPWEMTIKKDSVPYKSITKVFRGIENVPSFVKNNGCPWVIISTLCIIPALLIFLNGFIFAPVTWIGKKMDESSEKSAKKRKLLEEVKQQEDKEAFEALCSTVSEEDLKRVWHFDRGTGMDSNFKNIKQGIRQEDFLSDFVETRLSFLRDQKNIYLGKIYFEAFKKRYPDDYKERFAKIEVPKLEDCEMYKDELRIEKARNLAKEAKIARDERLRKACLKITNFVQGSMNYALALITIGAATLLGWGVFELVANMPAIIGFLKGILASLWGVITWVCSAPWADILLISVQALGIVMGGVITVLFLSNERFQSFCEGIKPVFKKQPFKTIGWLGKWVAFLFNVVIQALGSLFSVFIMALKSECPVTKFK